MQNVDEILALSPAEKILLIEKVWDSIADKDKTVTEMQKNEILNRIKRYREGKSKSYTWEEIKREIHSL